MKFKDRVYGEVEISEPVLLEIIDCPTFQRLKDIDQGGYFEPYYPGTQHSRFEHSVGVCLLLKKYGALIEEQIAGLIHDVSHSAFSHCIDYVLNVGSEKEQSHQDNVFDDFVRKSEIPEILLKYNFDLDYILDDKNFPLKEKELPDLCADRIDYSLRDACVFGELKNPEYFLDNLVAEEQKWIFKNFESAKKHAELFNKLNNKYWAGLVSNVMFKGVSDYLKYSLSKNYISKADLYTTDKIVLAKVEPFHGKDKQLQLLFDRMNNKIGFKNNPNDFDGEVFCKSRVVDPLCRHNGEVKRVSEIDASWGKILEEESKPKHYFIKFER
ncbi:MAG: hypothetical protein UU10_C0013G0008 [Parcubacteria group bacterium GW2011_GWF1_40_6]|uniref:HD/PDEase domain-containing protein n=2 Tax=Candidatus Nomuraibacteriota TaxID=1752729 RepID=A0A0G0QPW5_9BACT|nr:MAG: hypothetical protein UT78_C0015G0002 [Candidatus Nomurabacteria bacterium GW2011_GWF2_40_12]KKR69521.1 MAG: hypothetical protein UU10_C0013G0008 [Parcubacteria group bacterium GW2011_GWF1_40_6]OGJ08930.1 MAG: hypothetical protein A2356_02500 [Candidatus Nomurabacteria bacterium RIFOXYB1_FULL_39_16]OGJ15043.1 MAG: hypothetical protein A2585_03785 [Candidatus Nomurabacteria bacterium RIFOXYD1_FULL_39_12]